MGLRRTEGPLAVWVQPGRVVRREVPSGSWNAHFTTEGRSPGLDVFRLWQWTGPSRRRWTLPLPLQSLGREEELVETESWGRRM